MNTNTAMEEFQECLFNLELDDMPFSGPLFTWINRRVGDQFVARKLDRSLQNESTLDAGLIILLSLTWLRMLGTLMCMELLCIG